MGTQIRWPQLRYCVILKRYPRGSGREITIFAPLNVALYCQFLQSRKEKTFFVCSTCQISKEIFSASIISWHFLAPRSHSSCVASFSVKVLDIYVDSLWFLFHIMQSSSIYMVQSLICLLPSGAFPYSQNNGFSSSHVGMWELDHKEGWMPKNWCFWTVVLKKTREGPLFLLDNFKEIKQLNPKGNQLWKLIGRTDAKEYKNTQKNCTKKIFTTKTITMVWSLT